MTELTKNATSKKTISSLILLFITCLITFLITEIFSRMWFGNPMPAKYYPQVYYDSHEVRRFTLRPNQTSFTFESQVNTDDMGFRKNGDSDITGQQHTILALGDSFTFGMGVDNDQTWPALLEVKINTNQTQVSRVINAGTISYGVFQEMNLLQEIGLKTKPDIVIHGFYWNDFMNSAAPKPTDPPALTNDGHFTWEQQPTSSGSIKHFIHRIISSSAFLYTLKQAVNKMLQDNDISQNNVSAYGNAYRDFINGSINIEAWKPVDTFYRKLKQLSQQNKFTPLVIIMPVIDLIDKTNHPYPGLLIKLLNKHGIDYVDGVSFWQNAVIEKDSFLPQGLDSHLNPNGYEILTKAIYKKIKPKKQD